ncbi:MAG: tRNA (adenosine(37)-N6)-dimethylallyltransferase MiaA [Clostridia bacterium]|nr:tRNA (adenosine(37)-N6)-dimethylallyltransferase MiaA [Clostridia bacterium]
MANCEKLKILAVVGPTASGKSALAVALAHRLGGEIVSCDSMQIYRRMDIGTAKPSAEETDGIPHHLIDTVEPHASFSCADYVCAARAAVAEIAARGKLPILCGGTGLYLDAFLRGRGFEETECDPALRQSLFDFAQAHGNHALHERLAQVDPESAAAIHENNVKRVVRALEIYETTGMTKTEADRRSRQFESPYDATVIGLRYEAREVLYARIDRRVDKMLADGLLDETRALMAEGVFERNATAAQAIGYKELLGYLRGEQSLDEATEALKRATRRYAKRQMTWFGAKEYVRWIDVTEDSRVLPFEEIVNRAMKSFTGSEI